MIIGIIISILVSYIIFPRLKRMKQVFRIDGPDHKNKEGTPSMGGIIFIISTLITYLILIIINKTFNLYSLMVILPFIGYGMIGFLDDYLKHHKNTNEGLSPKNKMILEVIVAIIYFFVYLSLGLDTKLFNINLKWIYGILVLLIFTSTTNAINLTDGLDGLATGLVIISMYLYYFISKDNINVNLFTTSLISSLFIFLFLNFKPAKIFMGDTGSLALGGALANMAILLKVEFSLLIIGLPFIVEVLSVVIQVIYYKLTKKRIFKMAPLHHHFELCGIKEVRIVEMFYLFGIIVLIISLFIYL